MPYTPGMVSYQKTLNLPGNALKMELFLSDPGLT
jgi:hypothetical protein